MVNRSQLIEGLIKQKLFKKLTFEQIHSINVICDVFYEYYKDERCLAYILGTIYHETARTMLPIEERGWWGRWYAKLVGGKRYYGRGYIQLTHRSNYERVGNKIGKNLVGKPELALDTTIAARIAVLGCMEGWFTSRKLTMYFKGEESDWFGARKVVNGTDKAFEIANYGKRFLEAMEG